MRAFVVLSALVLGLLPTVVLPPTAQAEGEEEPVPTPTPAPPKKKPIESPKDRGIASWYRTKRVLAAAHRTLPLGTKVKVSTEKGQSVIVTIVGRGPFIKGRIIDLSSDAFKRLASLGTGILRVTVQRLR